MVPIHPIETVFVSTQDFSNGGANNGTLQYTGKLPKYFHIAASISSSAVHNNDILVYGVAHNDVPVNGSKILKKLGQTTDVESAAMHVVLYLEENDTIDIYVGNISDAADIIVKSLNFVAVSMK